MNLDKIYNTKCFTTLTDGSIKPYRPNIKQFTLHAYLNGEYNVKNNIEIGLPRVIFDYYNHFKPNLNDELDFNSERRRGDFQPVAAALYTIKQIICGDTPLIHIINVANVITSVNTMFGANPDVKDAGYFLDAMKIIADPRHNLDMYTVLSIVLNVGNHYVTLVRTGSGLREDCTYKEQIDGSINIEFYLFDTKPYRSATKPPGILSEFISHNQTREIHNGGIQSEKPLQPDFDNLSGDEKTIKINDRNLKPVTININDIKVVLESLGYDTIDEIYFVMVHKTAIECVQTYLDAEKVIQKIQTDIETAMNGGEEEPMSASDNVDSVRSTQSLPELQPNSQSDDGESDDGESDDGVPGRPTRVN